MKKLIKDEIQKRTGINSICDNIVLNSSNNENFMKEAVSCIESEIKSFVQDNFERFLVLAMTDTQAEELELNVSEEDKDMLDFIVGAE